MKNSLFLLFIAMFLGVAALAQPSPVGVWKTIDDKTGEAKSYIEIYEQGGQYFGKVSKLLVSSPDKKCTECPGKKKGQPILGMVVLEGMKPYQDYWKKGSILDPETGNEYGCTIWFENGNPDELKVRGIHWTGLYRTQAWYRVK
ncbi:MAG: DUF2147 domain-containing protein [Phaeodactylibacter sp.]|nr:DUF2147 domain-containing protein [Phaeodactylibacter sp.]MCB9304317.1 DUF2147 domain-containing protein [Lewinellaceae bacterium]